VSPGWDGQPLDSHGRKSISVVAVEDTQQGHSNDLQIEGEAPVAKIIQIVLDTLCDRSVPGPAVYGAQPVIPTLKV
jgi:hypothetical protein